MVITLLFEFGAGCLVEISLDDDQRTVKSLISKSVSTVLASVEMCLVNFLGIDQIEVIEEKQSELLCGRSVCVGVGASRDWN